MLVLGPRHKRLKLGGGQPHRHDLRCFRTRAAAASTKLATRQPVNTWLRVKPYSNVGSSNQMTGATDANAREHRAIR